LPTSAVFASCSLIFGHQVRGKGQRQADGNLLTGRNIIISTPPLDDQAHRKQFFEMMIELAGRTHSQQFPQGLATVWSLAQEAQDDDPMKIF